MRKFEFPSPAESIIDEKASHRKPIEPIEVAPSIIKEREPKAPMGEASK